MIWVKLLCLVLSIIVCIPANAADTCFCLGDQDDALWYDCQTFRVGNSPYLQFECRPAVDTERVHVKQGHLLQRYEVGEGPCVPCKVKLQVPNNQIRGDSDSNASPSNNPAAGDAQGLTLTPNSNVDTGRSNPHE